MSLQGRSQDLNGSLQEIPLNFDNNVIIMTLMAQGKDMKSFKYCAISLNMLHTGELFGIFGFIVLHK